MATKRRLIPWVGKPPLGASLNALHPLTTGLTLSCALNENAGSKVYDGVAGREFTISGAGWEGGAFSLRLATGSISISGLPCQINSTNKWSLVVRAKGAPYSNTGAPFISVNFDAELNYWALVKQQYTAELYFRGRFNNYGDFVGGDFLPAGFFEQDAVETIVLTISGYNATVYRENGTIYTATLGTSSNVTATTVVVGNTANTNYRGVVDLVQFYNRTLSPDEASSIISNPWQSYQPRTIWIPVSGGGGTSVTGSHSITFDPFSSANTGTLAIAGAHSQTLAAVTQSQAGALTVTGSHAQTISALVQTQTGTLSIIGQHAHVLDVITQLAIGVVGGLPPIVGGSSVTFGDLTATATGAVTVNGAGAVTLDPLTALQAGAILTTGQAAQVIAAITDSKTGAVAISGSHDAVMAAITQLATGRVYDASAVIQTTDKGLVAIVERRGVLALPAEDRGIKWTH